MEIYGLVTSRLWVFFAIMWGITIHMWDRKAKQVKELRKKLKRENDGE